LKRLKLKLHISFQAYCDQFLVRFSLAGMVRDEEDEEIPTSITQAKVLYAYTPREDDELNVETGMIVSILQMEDDWWQCECDGEIGMLPSNYLKILDRETPVDDEEINQSTSSPERTPQNHSPYPMSRSKLPDNWKMFVDNESGDIYYHNELTGRSSFLLFP
jgi:hypothetical protein